MNIAIVSTRGYTIDDRYQPRELCIIIDNKIESFVWKPLIPIENLGFKQCGQVKKQENLLGCLPYSYGMIQDRSVTDILEERISGSKLDMILCCGSSLTETYVVEAMWACESEVKCNIVNEFTYQECNATTRKEESLYCMCGQHICLQVKEMLERIIKDVV